MAATLSAVGAVGPGCSLHYGIVKGYKNVGAGVGGYQKGLAREHAAHDVMGNFESHH